MALFTDFGLTGPYMGWMRAALHEAAPKVSVIDLFADAPTFDVRAASYLLAAWLAEVIYVDHYGNVLTGLRAAKLSTNQTLRAGGVFLSRSQTFGDAPVGEVFLYENANGLVEVSVNQGSAAEDFNLYPGKK